MSLFNKPFRALIIGSTGTVGSALVSALESHPSCHEVIGLHRNSDPVVDYDHLETIIRARKGLLNKDIDRRLYLICQFRV